MKSVSRILVGSLFVLGVDCIAAPAGLVAPPGAFALTAPASGATGVPLTPTFTWGASAGADSYTLEVATDPGFTTIVLSQVGIGSTSYTPGAPVAQGLTFYWRVFAVNLGGCTLATGSPFSFSTNVPAPGPFVLISPADAATGVALLPTFTWTASSGVATYTLEVSTNSSFSSLVFSQSDLTTTSFLTVTPLTGGTNYYWRVTAVNCGGSTLATGAPFCFQTVCTGPGCFALLCPANCATGVELNPHFFWENSTGADSYTLELATDPAFCFLVFKVIGIPGSSFCSTLHLRPKTTYYWRVTAVNACGCTMATGSPFRFQTLDPNDCGPGGTSGIGISGGVSGSSGGDGYSGSSGKCGLLGLEWLAFGSLWVLGRRRR